jgi:hypothetical protein
VKFTWAPGWTHALLIVGCMTGFGIVPWLVLRVVLHKSMLVHLSMCDRHRRYWMIRQLFAPICVFGSLIVLIGSMMLSDSTEIGPPTWALIVSFGLLVVALVSFLVFSLSGTRVSEMTTETITFEGASENFVEALNRDRDTARREEREWFERRSQTGQRTAEHPPEDAPG